ncbi:septum formation family protein [uncultured Corynebacterium sp.]|uniref:septum formation family protein n=1 Tax=uncultured Corynebacterium sp. TaxID=159447 RepID=UPI0025CE89F9|nr:septum formation family protein [uncultured Corynebacterium sp.]
MVGMSTEAPSQSAERPLHPRRRRVLRTVLVAALCGGVAAATYAIVSPDGSSPVVPERKDAVAAEPAAFSDADAGNCLNWTQDGTVTRDIVTVDCAQPHRFEVATREDLSQYPTSEFGEDAPQPDLQRQAQLTAELCTAPVTEYMGGRLDPTGRYTISPILPPAEGWAAGDRTMLCGVMVTDPDGTAEEVSGVAAGADQSRYSQVDVCVRANGNTASEVPCEQPHSWQVTKVVNLGENFNGAWPTVEDQNKWLAGVCQAAAVDYLGGGDAGDEALYQSTLAPFWTTIAEDSWNAGSRTVNCALTKGRDGAGQDGAGDGFADLAGDVRGEFTIDGNPPAEQPARNPRR